MVLKLKNRYSILLFIFLLPQIMVAQSEESTDSNTNILSLDLELIQIQAKARSSEEVTKLSAIEHIQSLFNENRIDQSNLEFLQVLETLAGEGTVRIERNGNDILNDFVEVRRQAVEMLGQVAGDYAIEVLIGVCEQDRDTRVLAEAVFALGTIANEKANEALNAIAQVIRNSNSQTILSNDNLAYACLLSLEKLLPSSDREVVVPLLQAMQGIVNGNYIRGVKQKAVEVINQIRERF
jgi:HEAT repeat protein